MRVKKGFLHQRYTCQSCGKCCRSWNIPLDTWTFEALNDIRWVRERINETDSDFEFIEGCLLLPKYNGNCVFLDPDDSLCTIHKREGTICKPKECMKYPFAFTRDPEGNLYADFSFYCKAILENDGVPLSDSIDDTTLKNFAIPQIAEELSLTFTKKAPYQTGIDCTNRLSTYILANSKQYYPDEWFGFLYKGLLSLKKYIKHYPNKDLKELLLLQAEKDVSSRIIKDKKQVLTALFVKRDSIFLDMGKLYAGRGKITTETFKEFLSLELVKSHTPTASLEKVIEGKKLDLKALNHTPIELSPDLNFLLARYLISILNRKSLLAFDYPILSIYLAVLITYCNVTFYTKAFAHLNERDTATMDDLKAAIFVTERFYIGHNKYFLAMFNDELKIILISWLLR